MKKLLYTLSILSISLTFILPCHAMMVGTIETNVDIDDSTERIPVSYANDAQLYTTGGVTFNYPVGLFAVTTTPSVQVGIQPVVAHPTTETFVAEISANGPLSTTIMVYNLVTTLGVVSIAEAPNGSVTVYLMAIGA